MAFLPPDRLAVLYRVSQTFNSTLELDDVLARVMDEVIAVMHAERGFLMLRNAQGQLEFQVARGLDQRTIAAPEFQISRGLVDRVAAEGQPRLTSDAQSDAWLGARASVAGLGLRSILCVPLQLKGVTTGVIYVDNRLQVGIFNADDLDLLSTIAATAATAIENARLYKVAVEKGRLEQELDDARTVQSSLIPAATPHFPGWEFAAAWQPAHVVGGDYYDFITVTAPDLVARQGVVIADVSDKGMGAALFMAVARSVVRASALTAGSPAQCIAQANRLICADAPNGMFVTMCYVLLDSTGALRYVNAGHNVPLIYQARTAGFAELVRTGIALGVDEASEYKVRSAHLDANDFLVLYTDGVTDATNAQEQEFGEDNLRRILYENRDGSAKDIIAAIEQALRAFVGAAPQFDDMTITVAKRL